LKDEKEDEEDKKKNKTRKKITLTLPTELKWEPELVWTLWKAAKPDSLPEIDSIYSWLALVTWKPAGRQYNQCPTHPRSNTFAFSRQHSY
jgi:hypothetical protein